MGDDSNLNSGQGVEGNGPFIAGEIIQNKIGCERDEDKVSVYLAQGGFSGEKWVFLIPTQLRGKSDGSGLPVVYYYSGYSDGGEDFLLPCPVVPED